MVGKSEIIVGGKIQQRLAVHLRVRQLGRVDAAQFAIQTALADRVESCCQLFVKCAHRPSFCPNPEERSNPNDKEKSPAFSVRVHFEFLWEGPRAAMTAPRSAAQ